MTLADEIRGMSDEELAEFLVWDLPDECEGCKNSDCGCAIKCGHYVRTDRMLNILHHTRREVENGEV